MTDTHANKHTRLSGEGGSSTAGPLSLIGLSTSVGAVFTGWCCVLPSALAAFGAGGAGLGSLSQLAPYQPYFLAVALVSVTASWISLARRRSAAACEQSGDCAWPAPRRWTFGILALSTLFLMLALASAWMQHGL